MSTKEVININKIKELRLDKNLTQEELGILLGVKKNTVCQWETGKRIPSLSMLRAIAAYFNCTIDDLIDKSRYDESTA